MKAFQHKFNITLVCFLCILLVNGCRERGCTNPAAINYNSVADEDDGSCIICQASYEELGTKFDDMVDNNFSSPHFNQSVAIFTVIQQRVKYNNNMCNSEGGCIVVIRVESLVNESMFIPSYSLQCSGGLSFSYNDPINVGPYQSITLDTLDIFSISNPCGNISSSTLNVFLNGSIFYQ